MSKVTLKNLTRRPVSFRANSGGYAHLPPHYAAEFEAVDVQANATVEKLVERGVLALADAGDAERARPAAQTSAPAVEHGDVTTRDITRNEPPQHT